MYQYVAYGLGIHSDIALGETETPARADVTIRVTPPAALDDSTTHDGEVIATAQDTRFVYRALGAFVIRDGATIEATPVSDADAQQFRLAILGPAFAILLHQRGDLVLHASAIALNGAAVAFLGAPGWGKSTTAAALAQRGGALIADDIVAVRFENDQPVVYPAFAYVKIWADVARALGADLRDAARIAPDVDKFVQPLARADSIAIPLARVYVLEPGDQVALEAFTPQNGFIELVRHTFVVHLLDATGATATHFEQCARVAKHAPVKRLRRPPNLDSLAQIVELVERDAR
jgi:hypothetical protein